LVFTDNFMSAPVAISREASMAVEAARDQGD